MRISVPSPVASTALQAAFQATSPRHQEIHTPWRSALIHGGVLLAWGLLTLMALHQGALWAWSVGVAYVLYDTSLLVFTTLSTWHLVSTPAAGAEPATSTPNDNPVDGTAPALTIGVIVAAHNEASVLPATLAALMAQKRLPDLVLIADDGSTDATATLLTQEYGLAPLALTGDAHAGLPPGRLHWLQLPRGGKARALNAALPLLTADVLLTIDADTLVEPDALAAVERAFLADRRLVAASGVLRPVCADDWQGRVLAWFQTYEYLRNYLSRHAWARADGLLLISGAFAAFRRQAVLEVGGFDTGCLVEDYELIHRLRRFSARQGLGWTTSVIGGARARTEAPSTVGAFVRQRRRWFGGFLQTQYWYRDMVGEQRYGAVGTRMLPVKAIDTLQPLFGLTALAVAFANLFAGHWQVLFPVAGVITAKIAVDLLFHLWSVHVYRRWLQLPTEGTGPHLAPALLAALAEPFTFQILRHVSAALGWWGFLRGRDTWGTQHRVALLQPALEPAQGHRQ